MICELRYEAVNGRSDMLRRRFVREQKVRASTPAIAGAPLA